MAHLSEFWVTTNHVVYSASHGRGSPASQREPRTRSIRPHEAGRGALDPTCTSCIGRCGNGICRCLARVFCLAPVLHPRPENLSAPGGEIPPPARSDPAVCSSDPAV